MGNYGGSFAVKKIEGFCGNFSDVGIRPSSFRPINLGWKNQKLKRT